MIRNTLFVLICFIILRAAIVSPFGALMGYIWFALFRPQEWVWMDIEPLRLSLVLGVILLFRSVIDKAWPNFTHPLSIGIIFFLVTGLVAQTNAVDQAVGWYWLDFFARLALVSLFLITLVNTERRFYIAMLTISSSLGYYTAKAGVASLIGGGVHFYSGLAGAFVDNNSYAVAGAIITPMLLAVAANAPHEWRYRRAIVWGYRVAVPLTALTIIGTFSRAGLLAFIAAVFTRIMFQRRRLVALCTLIVIASVALQFIPLPKGYTDRAETITTYDEVGDTSALSRLYFWRIALIVAADNPLGVGLFNFSSVYDKYDLSGGKYGKNRAVHNSHLQVLTELGFAGFAIWVWLFFIAFRTCFRIRRIALKELAGTQSEVFLGSMAVALIASMVAFLVGGTFISFALNDLTWLTFALVAALDQLCNTVLQAQDHSSQQPSLLKKLISV